MPQILDQVKKYIPRWIKKFPAWLFLADQRQEGVIYTLMVELRGTAGLLLHWLKPGKVLKPVTICTGIRNRTDNYLSYVLPSILRMKHRHLVSISIFDCGSEDKIRLETEIRKKWDGVLHFETEDVPFSRSYSFNKAVGNAHTELIFSADADLSLPENLVELCNRYVTPLSVWFPVFFDLKKDAEADNHAKNGQWLPDSFGMFASTIAQFNAAGQYNERFKKWGLEDSDLWLRFYKAGYYPIRTRPRGLLHHWHAFTDEKKEYLTRIGKTVAE